MLLLGVIFLASALAQPTVYLSRSPISYPRYRVYLEIPDETVVKESEPTAEQAEKEIPEAPVLYPLSIVPIIGGSETNVEEIDEIKQEIEEKKEEIEEMKKEIEEIKEEKKDEIEEKKEEVLEHKNEEEELKEEIPVPVEIEEDKKIVVQIKDPKPPKFIASIISALPIKLPSLPIKLPSFALPFDFGSWWKPKEKVIRLVPSYALA